jgi:hypothetical protein
MLTKLITRLMICGHGYFITVEDGISFSHREKARMRGYKKSDYSV